jgi:hypothetical protein
MPASQARRVEALRTLVGQLEVALTAAEAEYGRQLARNRDELVALRAGRSSELCSMLVALTSANLAAERQAEAGWRQLAGALPEPAMTTAYMAQRSLHVGSVP